jgi:hypothetical protein
MFCDVSGFTKLSEAMAKRGPEGAEYLIHYLNFYFSQVRRAQRLRSMRFRDVSVSGPNHRLPASACCCFADDPSNHGGRG